MTIVHGKIYYNETNTCPNILKNGDICERPLVRGKTCRERHIDGEFTERYVCLRCYNNIYSRNLHDSHDNLIKQMRDSRLDNLDINSESGKTFVFEQVTCKTRGFENLNLKNDNFHSKNDHSIDKDYGILDTKVSLLCMLNWGYEGWQFNTTKLKRKEFDNMIGHCTDRHMKNIEETIIIPKFEIMKRGNIRIYKNPIRKAWYEKYLIDEKSYNDAYHNLNDEDLSILKDRKDIVFALHHHLDVI